MTMIPPDEDVMLCARCNAACTCGETVPKALQGEATATAFRRIMAHLSHDVSPDEIAAALRVTHTPPGAPAIEWVSHIMRAVMCAMAQRGE